MSTSRLHSIRLEDCWASKSSRPPRAGYARLLNWLGSFGTVALVGIEGTGSYGAGLARHVVAAGPTGLGCSKAS